MLKHKTLLALTLAVATLGAMSVHADDRLLEKTEYGWYYSRTIRVDGQITAIQRSGDDWVLSLNNGARLVAHDGVDVRLGTNKDAHVWDLRQGDVVRVMGRPGANGTTFARRIDVTNYERERPRRRR
ncbi:MAG: hypothetical protein ACTHQM_08930 [Thermoanaerobaculia bacterium]